MMASAACALIPFALSAPEPPVWMVMVPPSISTLPEVGISSPDRTFIKVDLPAPFSPQMAWMVPASTEKATPERATVPLG